MKEAELRQHATCALCGNKVLAGGIPLFWKVTVERFCIDLNAVTRQQGLTMMMGSAVLAAAMGPDETMAQPMMEPATLTVCEACGTTDSTCIAALAERAQS